MKIDIGQLEFVDRRLRDILLWIGESTGMEFTITSLYRMNDDGVHGQLPLRGADLRCRDLIIGKAIENMVNHEWSYDRLRPEKTCAFLHGAGSNMHLHIQTHPNTIRR